MNLGISIRAANGVTISDLQGRATIGGNTDKLNRELRRLVAEGALKVLLNLA